MSCTIEWKKSVVIWHFDGEVSSEDLLNANTEVCSYPLIHQIKAQLILFSDASRITASGQAMKALAVQDSQLAKNVPEMRIAVVAENPGAIGLSRMYELASPETTWDSQIFSTREEAEAWVALPATAYTDA